MTQNAAHTFLDLQDGATFGFWHSACLKITGGRLQVPLSIELGFDGCSHSLLLRILGTLEKTFTPFFLGVNQLIANCDLKISSHTIVLLLNHIDTFREPSQQQLLRSFGMLAIASTTAPLNLHVDDSHP
uniref:Uncharacterized protein n=1 Tax=Oxyrrhis marina TaxID=2969 RepID=A0A7S3UN28_OXYMA